MSKNKKSKSAKVTYKPNQKMWRTVLFIMGLLAAFACVTIGRLFWISVKNHAIYEAMANENQFKETMTTAERGNIYDTNGQILAQSITVYTIAVAPKVLADLDNMTILENLTYTEQTRQKEAVARILSDNIDEIEYSDILAKLNDQIINNPTSQWMKIASKIEKPVADRILEECKAQELENNVVFRESDTKRTYPENDLAASVIGFTNYDGDGIYGVEAFYNDYLAGIDGKTVSATDANGNIMPYDNDVSYSAKDGSDIYLTIDKTLQYYVEKNLTAAVKQFNIQNRATAIMMNAKTGAILAMATCPGYNINERNEIYSENDRYILSEIEEQDLYDEKYAQLREKQWKNKAITELYYPGSVFKVITGSAALEEGTITTGTNFNCNAVYTVVDTDIHCWSTAAHGYLDFTRAMTVSCNPYFMQVGQSLGGTKFLEYLEAYGFTEKTGIDLPGEVDSITIPAERLGPVELASCSFGQSNKITPIQMITAYAAAINGGYLLQPYVCDKIVDSNGNIVLDNTVNVKRQVISEETSAVMREVLENVVSGNGGGNAYIKGYRIGGKSGTAEKQDENNARKRDDLYASSYVGFAPANDPEVVMLVMVDEPMSYDENGKQIYYGSITATPIVRDTFKEALPYLGYYAEYTDEELAQMDIIVPSVEGQSIDEACKNLEGLSLSTVVIGEGQSVVSQTPSRGSSIPHEGTVILYTDEDYETEYTVVPDVLGYSVSDVKYLLSQAGLNIKIGDGAANHAGATASAQYPYYGDYVPKGSAVEVDFTVRDEG